MAIRSRSWKIMKSLNRLEEGPLELLFLFSIKLRGGSEFISSKLSSFFIIFFIRICLMNLIGRNNQQKILENINFSQENDLMGPLKTENVVGKW